MRIRRRETKKQLRRERDYWKEVAVQTHDRVSAFHEHAKHLRQLVDQHIIQGENMEAKHG